MNPLIRFHSIVLSATGIAVFNLWEILIKTSKEHPDFKIPLATVTTIGIYQLFVFIFKTIIFKIRFIKKFIFGAYYLEGVWIGFFIGKEDKVRFYVETYEQDFDSIVIRGKGFRENEGYFGSWISESVSINVKKGTLNYTYETDAFSNSFINPGLANFVFDRETKDSPPFRLLGFSADLYNPKKLKSFEEKIHDKPHVKNIEEVLNRAKQLYQNHQYFVEINE